MKKMGYLAISLIVALVALANRSGAAVDKSLMLYFTFDEGSGDTARDLSGNKNNGTIHEAKWVNGKINKALDFSGKSYVEIPHSESLSPKKDITVMAWTNAKAGATGELMIISKGDWAANDLPYELSFYTPDNVIYWQFYDAAGRDSCNTPLPDFGEWHHISGTYDGSQFKLYMDGELKREFVYAGTLPQNTAVVTVGKRSRTDSCYFQGMIDEVAVFNRALNIAEIKDAMDGLDAASVDARYNLITLWGKLKSK